MNKKEATEAISNFIDFNSLDIALLYQTQPEIGSAFKLVLNELSKEYGSGEDFTEKITEITTIKKIQRPIQLPSELKIGDRVYIPKTKEGSETYISYSGVISRNKNPFLYLVDIRGTTYVLNNELNPSGDFFVLSDLTPYPGNVMIGDVLTYKDKKLKITGYTNKNYKYKLLSLSGEESSKDGDLEALLLARELSNGMFKIEGVENETVEQKIQPKTETTEQTSNMIDPDDYSSLIGLTVQVSTTKRFDEYKITKLNKINPKFIKYNSEKNGRNVMVDIQKSVIPKILRGQIVGGTSVNEIYKMKTDEKEKRIKNFYQTK